MTFVILGQCCNDASCTDVCPVDCIHPTPSEPDFMRAEMLHIDPGTCIDCGACVDECPVDAIRADHEVDEEQSRFLDVNAGYFEGRTPIAAVDKDHGSAHTGFDFTGKRTAIVGAGPSAFYAAIELSAIRGMEVDIFERRLTPYGLVRLGVSPDHQSTKDIADIFRHAAGRKNVRVRLGVEIGTDITHDELVDHYDAVIYATGAPDDRRLGIPGEELPGSHSAAEFVAWYNGDPEFADRTFDLSSERAVIVGNGNVALDVARILTAPLAELALTDIADHALDALGRSRIREIVILGRRGAAHAAFTNPELIALLESRTVEVFVENPAWPENSEGLDHARRVKVELLREIECRPRRTSDRIKRIVLRFCGSPVDIIGTDSVTGIEIAQNVVHIDSDGSAVAEKTEEAEILEAGLVLRSVGYRGRALSGVPFDVAAGIVPNTQGRVTGVSGESVPGVYVTGWVKRGPTGVIGSNKKCAADTVHCVLADMASGLSGPPACSREDLEALIATRAPTALDFDRWTQIDAAEKSAGARQQRPRLKFVSTQDLRAAANGLLRDRY